MAWAWPLDNEQIQQEELDALIDEFECWSTCEGSNLRDELAADAYMIAFVWAVNNRISGEALPNEMIDMLPVWQEIMCIRMPPGATEQMLRDRISARFLSYAGNRRQDIERLSETIFGDAFVQVTVPTMPFVYMPGISPGPPGFEFSSNRAAICIHIDDTNLTLAEYTQRRASLLEELGNLLPTWTRFQVGVDIGDCFANQLVAGYHIIGQPPLV